MYHAIREYVSAGYSVRKITKILRCSHHTVTKYTHGDFESLCRTEFRSGMDRYHDDIIKSLESGVSRKDIYDSVCAKGYKGKRTAAYDYMNKLIKRHHIEVSVYRSILSEAVEKKRALQKYDHMTRGGVFRFLWRNEEIPDHHRQYLFERYPKIHELYACVKEFRHMFEVRSIPMLHLFIERYKGSELKEISVFAKGLERDIEAVENAVSSELSNGFVEGTNSKLKMVKRVMYGRCSRELLSAKLMYVSPLRSPETVLCG